MTRPALPDPASLAAAVAGGERAALARAITLAESTRDDHRAIARDVSRRLPEGRSLRVGVTGAPGAGKSTLLDALGMHLVEAGHRVAVLAVDPSSTRTGGAILGDKTRMERLATHDAAFVRPTASGGTLGGVARQTRAAMRLVEGAGYDVVIVETVGVGQSETAVRSMVDVFVLLVLAQGGDELQGVKRGVMEMADLVVVHKADLDPDGAREALRRMRGALHLLPPSGTGLAARALAASGATGEGVAALWETVEAVAADLRASGAFEAQRKHQRLAHVRAAVRDALDARFFGTPAVRDALPDLDAAVAAGTLSPDDAADRLLALLP